MACKFPLAITQVDVSEKNGHLCHLRDFKEVYQHGDNQQEHAS